MAGVLAPGCAPRALPPAPLHHLLAGLSANHPPLRDRASPALPRADPLRRRLHRPHGVDAFLLLLLPVSLLLVPKKPGTS